MRSGVLLSQRRYWWVVVLSVLGVASVVVKELRRALRLKAVCGGLSRVVWVAVRCGVGGIAFVFGCRRVIFGVLLIWNYLGVIFYQGLIVSLSLGLDAMLGTSMRSWLTRHPRALDALFIAGLALTSFSGVVVAGDATATGP
jgi:hypothetical protein